MAGNMPHNSVGNNGCGIAGGNNRNCRRRSERRQRHIRIADDVFLIYIQLTCAGVQSSGIAILPKYLRLHHGAEKKKKKKNRSDQSHLWDCSPQFALPRLIAPSKQRRTARSSRSLLPDANKPQAEVASADLHRGIHAGADESRRSSPILIRSVQPLSQNVGLQQRWEMSANRRRVPISGRGQPPTRSDNALNPPFWHPRCGPG
jgi:hypothetical protein